jgi:hypothetical protein
MLLFAIQRRYSYRGYNLPQGSIAEMNLRFFLDRAICAIPAFCVGWFVYMVAMFIQTYDGVLSLIFQPLMAAFFSALFVGLSLLFGLLLLIPFLRSWWTSTRMWAATIAGLSLFILIFGYYLGISDIGTHPETGQKIEMLHPMAAVLGYWALIFAIANWPIRPDNRVISLIENWIWRLIPAKT